MKSKEMIAEAEQIIRTCTAEDRDPNDREERRLTELVGADGMGGLVAKAQQSEKRASVLQSLTDGTLRVSDGTYGRSEADFSGASASSPSAGRWLSARGESAAVLDRGAKLSPSNGGNKNLLGEAEARAAQKRIDYSPAKRREVFPLDDYDVPLGDLLMLKQDETFDAMRHLLD